jgi:signal transduction histidine kinase
LTSLALGPVLAAVLYYLGAQLAFCIGTLSDQIFALFWLPNVVLFCALMISARRRWWWYIAAAFPVHVIAELGVGMPVLQLLLAFATNCTVALLNAYAVRRFVGDPPWFGDFHKALAYIVIAAGIVPAVAALGGAFVPIVGGNPASQYWVFWLHWYFANALPNLTLGPVFLIWYSAGLPWKPGRLSCRIEFAALAALLCLSVIVAAAAAELTVARLFAIAVFLPSPFILWAAVRFGEKGASSAILVVAVTLMARTLHGDGLVPGGDPDRNLLALQLFLTGLAIPVLLLGASIDELRRAGRTTRQFAVSLARAQDEERRRIARDLHDSTGQNLIAATLLVERVARHLPDDDQADMRQLAELLQQSIREVRTVSYLLHPPLLDEAGLAPALRNLVDGFSDRSGVRVTLDIADDVGRQPPDIELALFRVVQEGLTNVARHSGSPTALIRLSREKAEAAQGIVLTVEDSGQGIPRPGRGHASIRGVGLTSLRERLYQIGGRLEFASVAGRTTLMAIVPLAGRVESGDAGENREGGNASPVEAGATDRRSWHAGITAKISAG